jgi:multiple sugar transport system substrate-binding protein
VKFWNGFTGADGVGIKQIVDKFNSENPKIKVEMNVYQWADFFQKFPAAVASGNGPNVAAMHVDDIGTAAAQNTIVPIQDIADALKLQESDFSPVVWQGGLYQNKRYGIPLDVHPLVMYWNKTVFTKAGLDPEKPPMTKDDFMSALDKMKSKGIKGFWVSPFQFTGGLLFFGLIYQFGGKVFSDDLSSVQWDQDPAVQALTWMVSLIKDGYSPSNVAQDADYVALHNAQNGININGIWQVNDTVNGTKNPQDFGAGPVPQIGSQNGVWADSHQFVLPRQNSVDPNVTQASEFFIKYVGENVIPWVKTGKIPASKTVLDSSEFKATPEAKLAPELDYAHFPPALPGVGDVLTEFYNGYQAAILGKADPASALKSSAQKGTQILQANRKKYGL